MKAGEFMMNAIWIPSYYSMVKFKFIIIIIKVYFDQVSLNTQFTVIIQWNNWDWFSIKPWCIQQLSLGSKREKEYKDLEHDRPLRSLQLSFKRLISFLFYNQDFSCD